MGARINLLEVIALGRVAKVKLRGMDSLIESLSAACQRRSRV
jgi:hypothetical protein